MANTARPTGTGKAQIVKQGYTTDGQMGSDPDYQGTTRKPVRDIPVK